jgi:cysteine desulfurase / selenocysteine lyase
MLNLNMAFGFIKNNPEIIYFDSASTSLRHNSVIAGLEEYANRYGVNLGRSFGKQAQTLGQKVNSIRAKISKVYSCKNFFFASSATDGFNHIAELLVVNKIIDPNSSPFERIVCGIDNHHASILPFLEKRFAIQYIGLDKDFNLDIDSFESIESKPALISLTMGSNVLGNELKISDIKRIRKMFPNSIITLDCTQYLSYSTIDFDELGVDFVVASFHKMYGPTGLGIVMYDKKYIGLTPTRVGGGIVKDVTADGAIYFNDGSQFEAGTSNLDAIIGLDKLLDFLVDEVYNYTALDFSRLLQLEGYDFYNSSNSRKVISFKHKVHNNFDLANYLALNNIIVRVGMHCCNPLMHYLKLEDGLVRVSVGVYNTQADIDKLIEVLLLY